MNKKEEIIRLNRVLENTLYELKETNDRCIKLEIYIDKLNNAIIRQQECINYLQREIGKLKYEQQLAMLLDYLGLEVTTLPAQPEKKVLTKIKKTK